jgi:hypothetical protein
MRTLLLLLFPMLAMAQSDTVSVHYYTNGQVALRSTGPRERVLHVVYDINGNEVARQQGHHSSFTVHTTFRFHANGGVSLMDTHTNPGASMYWYDQLRSFSESGLLLQEESQRNGMTTARIIYHYDADGNRTSETQECWPGVY